MPYLNEDNLVDESISCRIMTAGLNLFVENGYHNVSVHDVQKLANVSIGSIYKHYGGKEGIAKDLYYHLLKELEQLVDGIIDSQADTKKCCEEIITRLFQHTESHRNIISFVFNAKHREFLSSEPPICSSTPFVKMRDLVQRGMKEGVFRRTDPWVAASTVFGGAIRMIQLRLDGMVENPLPDYLDEVLASCWYGICVPEQQK